MHFRIFTTYFSLGGFFLKNPIVVVFLSSRASTKYTVNVFGMFDGGESVPLAGEETTTLSDAPEPPPYQPSGT